MKVNVERTGKEEEGRGKGVAGMKQGKQGKCRQRQKWEEGSEGETPRAGRQRNIDSNRMSIGTKLRIAVRGGAFWKSKRKWNANEKGRGGRS